MAFGQVHVSGKKIRQRLQIYSPNLHPLYLKVPLTKTIFYAITRGPQEPGNTHLAFNLTFKSKHMLTNLPYIHVPVCIVIIILHSYQNWSQKERLKGDIADLDHPQRTVKLG